MVSDVSIIRDTAIFAIDKYYGILIEILSVAADSSVPRVSRETRSATNHWWSEELDDLKAMSLNAFLLWKDAGKPRSGPIFDVYRREKYSYKLAIRHARCKVDNSISNDLHDALLTKNNSQFWKIWKSRFGSERADNQMVDGLVDPVRISQLFADYFCGVCKPSSDEVNTRLREKFEYKFINYCGDKIALDEYFSVELISRLICDLKVEKSAGYDGIAAEHLLHCHPSCHVYITYLCNLMLLTGYVPSQFGIGLTFPIPKGKLDQKICSVDDFRGISVSPVISKILEKAILENFSSYLWSSDNQFGFKKKVGCSHAIYSLKSVIDHFVNNGSTVNLCSLDVSKAFDHVNHYALFTKLMERHIPVCVVMMFRDW